MQMERMHMTCASHSRMSKASLQYCQKGPVKAKLKMQKASPQRQVKPPHLHLNTAVIHSLQLSPPQASWTPRQKRCRRIRMQALLLVLRRAHSLRRRLPRARSDNTHLQLAVQEAKTCCSCCAYLQLVSAWNQLSYISYCRRSLLCKGLPLG